MGFKLGSETREIRMPHQRPMRGMHSAAKTRVIRKNLGDGIKAEANNDGTIFVDKKLPVNSKEFNRVIRHELKHKEDMETGKAAYGDEWVMWDGKIYIRKTIDGEKFIDGPAGRLPEGHPNHPWEQSAIQAEVDGPISKEYKGIHANINGDEGEESPNKFLGKLGKKLKAGFSAVVANNPISMGVRAIKGEDPVKIPGDGGEGESMDDCNCDGDIGGDLRARAKKAMESARDRAFSKGGGGGMMGGMGIGLGAGMAFQSLKRDAEAQNEPVDA